MEEKMSRKFWTLISLVLIAAVLLTACGTPATQTTPEPTQPTVAQPVNIRIWHQWQGAYLTAIEQVFRDYEASHEGVTITLESPENVQDALRVAIPAGEGPDIIGWAVDNIGQQALVGNIVPLNNLGVDMAFLESNFEPAAVNGVVWQDQIWGLPESQEGIALVYNRAIASEADFPANPSDFQDLLAKARAFRQANPDKYLVCNQGLGNPDAYHVGAIYFGHGVSEYVDDQGNVYINSPEALAAGEWMTQFRDVAPSETSHEICRTMLQEGQAAAWWTGPWAIADLEAAGMDYGILPMGSPFVGVKTLMISKNAVDRGNAEVALDIIRFFTNAENSKAIALANKTIPANTAALNDAEVAALATISGFGASLNLGVPMANTPFAGAQWGPVGDATTAIWNGSQTPAEALQAAQEAMETAIAEMQ
jgi:arabinogalactan oligomer / maltooligosaccharide transport system substrate-binding protein